MSMCPDCLIDAADWKSKPPLRATSLTLLDLWIELHTPSPKGVGVEEIVTQRYVGAVNSLLDGDCGHIDPKRGQTMDTSLSGVLGDVLAFRDARDWKQFHTPKNLAVSVSLEAAELLEVFQWLRDGESISEEKRSRAADEMADVLIYLLLLSDSLKVDLLPSVRAKLHKNKLKYPVSKAKGSAKKYDEL